LLLLGEPDPSSSNKVGLLTKSAERPEGLTRPTGSKASLESFAFDHLAVAG